MGGVCEILRTPISWNVVQAAGSYAQLAAVLGAVVFAGICLLLGSPPKDKSGITGRGFSNALTALPIVFVSILVTSHVYAVLDGEQDCARAFAIHISAAIGFALAAQGLLLALAWVFFAYGVAPGVLRNANLMFLMLLAVTTFYLYVTVGDAHEVLRRSELRGSSTATVLAILTAPPMLAFALRLRVGNARHIVPFHFSFVALFGAEIALAGMFASLSDVDHISVGAFPMWWEIAPLIVGAAASALLVLQLPYPASSTPSSGQHPKKQV